MHEEMEHGKAGLFAIQRADRTRRLMVRMAVGARRRSAGTHKLCDAIRGSSRCPVRTRPRPHGRLAMLLLVAFDGLLVSQGRCGLSLGRLRPSPHFARLSLCRGCANRGRGRCSSSGSALDWLSWRAPANGPRFDSVSPHAPAFWSIPPNGRRVVPLRQNSRQSLVFAATMRRRFRAAIFSRGVEHAASNSCRMESARRARASLNANTSSETASMSAASAR